MNQPTSPSQLLTAHRSPLTPLSLCAISFLLCVTLFGSGCVSQNAAAKFKEFEALGITEATITGKFSNTDYKVEHKDGTRRATLDHSNAWLPKVHLVRETKEAKP